MLLGVVESRKQQIFDQNKYVFEGVLLGYKQVRQLEWLGTGIDGKCAQQWERGAGPGVCRLTWQGQAGSETKRSRAGHFPAGLFYPSGRGQGGENLRVGKMIVLLPDILPCSSVNQSEQGLQSCTWIVLRATRPPLVPSAAVGI